MVDDIGSLVHSFLGCLPFLVLCGYVRLCKAIFRIMLVSVSLRNAILYQPRDSSTPASLIEEVQYPTHQKKK